VKSGTPVGKVTQFTMDSKDRVISYSGTYVNQQWPFNPAMPGSRRTTAWRPS
jgi:hypothetical protein